MRLIADGPERLDRFLARNLTNHSRSKLARLIEEGGVLVDGRLEKPSHLLKAGAEVVLEEPEEQAAHDLTPADIPLDVVYEDEWLLVVSKPRGLASHPAASLKESSLVNALLARGSQLSNVAGDYRPGIVHRLDKDTSGLMVVAKTDAVHVALAKQMESKSAERRYFAVVAGLVERDRFTVDAPIARNKANRLLMAVDSNGKRAVTHFKKIAVVPQGVVLGARLETGRTHQIRVHLSAVGLPVLGDRLYAPKKYAEGLLQLHAAYLEFTHPMTGERLCHYVAPDSEFYGFDVTSRTQLQDF
ncbi:MAG TPA: RluA family pseudouridine synthase [Fimbriimonas sp.]|nr:RluA family pseudouridine synthase [Fimbriimonas sp.]